MFLVIRGTRQQYFRQLDEYAVRLANFYGNTYWATHEDSTNPLSDQEVVYQFGADYLMLKEARSEIASITFTGDWVGHLYKFRQETLRKICEQWSKQWGSDESSRRSGPFPVLSSFHEIASPGKKAWYQLRPRSMGFNAFNLFLRPAINLQLPVLTKRFEADKKMGLQTRDDPDRDEREFDDFIRSRLNHKYRTL